MRKLVNRNGGRESPDDPSDAAVQQAERSTPAARRTAARVNEYTESGSKDAGLETAETGRVSDGRAVVPDYAQLGEHVSSVMQAASEAAKKIEEDARNHAEDLREQVKRQAASTHEEARQEAEKLLLEARRLRTEAESESKKARARADRYAAEKQREAKAEAAAVVARAEEVAQARASAAEERYRTLETNVELTEERLQQLVAGLYDTASRLDSLVERPPTQETGEESDSKADEDGSLEAALVASVASRETD